MVRPAIAATTGTAALARSVSSPMANSLVTSRPTMKKKNVIRPSLIRCLTVSSKVLITEREADVRVQ